MGPPHRRTRGLVAALVAAAAALVVWTKSAHEGGVSDVDQIWHGARALAAGGNPYEVVGPQGAVYWQWPLYYPLPAMLIAAPLAVLPLHAARTAFTAVAAGVFVFAVTAGGFAPLLLLLSVPFLHAVQLAQWSPLLAALFFLPGLAWLASAKPNLGLAVVLASGSVRALVVAAIGGALLVAASLVLLPGWPADWLRALATAGHVRPPVARLGGPLLLLSLLRWRQPEARLLGALACAPQTPCFYEALPVLLCARGVRETVLMVLLSDVSFVVSLLVAPAATSMLESAALYGRLINLFYYLPALVLVLRRPNEGPVPDWWPRVATARGRPAT